MMRAVERRGLAASCRSGHQNHAVGLGDISAELLQVAFGKADDFQAQMS